MLIANLAPLWDALMEDLRSGTPRGMMSAKFHRGVAEAYVQAAIAAHEQSGIGEVCLSGGVFHYRLLTGMLCRSLREAGLVVYLPVRVSPRYGGLSYGQAAVAAALLGERL